MANCTGKIFSVVCPYCDGENILPVIRANGDQPVLPNREIACWWCCALFLASESKLKHSLAAEAPAPAQSKRV